MKRFAAALLALLMLLCVLPLAASAAKQVVEPTEQRYVADYADVLSADTESWIVSSVQALKAQCGGEIAVVTIDFLTGGLDSEEYAYELINQWGVGDQDRQNGTVLLLVVGEGKGWVTTGTGAESFLPASRLEQILNDYLWDDFDAGNYDAAVTNTVAQLLARYESYYGVSADGTAAQPAYPQTVYEEPPRSHVFSTLARVALVVIVLLFLFGTPAGRSVRRHIWFFPFFGGWRRPPHDDRRGPRGGGFGGGGFGGGGFGGGGGRGGGAGRR